MSHSKYIRVKYLMIGFLIAIVLYLISLFFLFGLIGGIIGFFIAGVISSYKGKVNAKNGAIQGLAIGFFGWIVTFSAMMVVFGVPDFNYFIGDYMLIISGMNSPVEALIPVLYIIACILGGIVGSIIKR